MQKKVNKKFIIPLVLGLVILVVGVVLVLVVFPKVIDDQIIENVVLKKETVQLERFVKIPFPFKFSVYLYTIANKDEVLNEGKKPKVRQIGPYVYDEYKERRILQYGSEDLQYEEVWSFKFNKNASGSLSEDDEVTVINAPLISILQSVESAPLPFPPAMIEGVIGEILDSTELFMTVRVGDLTFKGIKMCHKKDKSAIAKLLCLTMSLMNQKMLEYHEDYALFSLFKYKTKADGPFVLNTGVTDSKKLGLISSYKGMASTEFWNGTYSACDKVNGYFTTFPPFMEENSSYNVYSSDICK
ncbi:sensory neuron membrane protein 2-like [Photinus pyralis]|nr:sensory neuron membrane protein 2-like [Photinus pyralis]XP_031357328.1 sensory neuron membrane protein 2-like [Photinus pyralis]